MLTLPSFGAPLILTLNPEQEQWAFVLNVFLSMEGQSPWRCKALAPRDSSNLAWIHMHDTVYMRTHVPGRSRLYLQLSPNFLQPRVFDR